MSISVLYLLSVHTGFAPFFSEISENGINECERTRSEREKNGKLKTKLFRNNFVFFPLCSFLLLHNLPAWLLVTMMCWWVPRGKKIPFTDDVNTVENGQNNNWLTFLCSLSQPSFASHSLGRVVSCRVVSFFCVRHGTVMHAQRKFIIIILPHEKCVRHRPSTSE